MNGSVWQVLSLAASFGRVFRRPLTLIAAFMTIGSLLTACGTLPQNGERKTSQAIVVVPEGNLSRIARAGSPSAELSGVRLLSLGAFALDARLQLMRRAAFSLDIQYYVIENDSVGLGFLRELRDASLRGVRVRLLVDDLFTAHTSELLHALTAYPNVEVRLFNPFCCARSNLFTRFAGSLFDLYRLNHRMHNKLMVADGVMALAGGRNVGEQYFMRSGVQNFSTWML